METTSLDLLKGSFARSLLPTTDMDDMCKWVRVFQRQAMLTGKTVPGANGNAVVNHIHRERGSEAHMRASPIWRKNPRRIINIYSIYSHIMGCSQGSDSLGTQFMHVMIKRTQR